MGDDRFWVIKKFLSSRWLYLLVGVLAFSITCAIVVGKRLASVEAMAIALGVSAGVLIGVAVGVVIGLSAGGRDRGPFTSQELEDGEVVVTLLLDQSQADVLIQLLREHQALPGDFQIAAPSRRHREFTAVGGAQLADMPDE